MLERFKCFKVTDFNKEQYELPEEDLKMDRNMLDRVTRFNAPILEKYIIIYR
jgi:hypothetical protein